MFIEPVVVETEPTREGEKTRRFTADAVAYIVADDVWGVGLNSKERVVRPGLFAFVSSAQQARAFAANLRLGRPAAIDREVGYGEPLRFELLRSAGYRFETHQVDDGVLTVAYIPELFAIQPAAVSSRLEFLCCPPRWWLDREVAALRPAWGTNAEQAARAAYFVAYLDRRSPLPIVNDLEFHVALLNAAIVDGWAWRPDTERKHFAMRGTEAIGLAGGLCCVVTEEAFAQTLSDLTLKYLETRPHGSNRIGGPRRLLPDTDAAAAQHRLAAAGLA